MVEQIIDDFNKYYNNKYKISKIFQGDGKTIIVIDTKGSMADGMFLYEGPKSIRGITPTLNPEMIFSVLKDDNLIYSADISDNEMAHAGYGGDSPLKGLKQDDVKYYKRIGEPGSYRYFYTKEAWDAYNKEQSTKKDTSSNKLSSEVTDYIKDQINKKNAYDKNAEAAKHEGDRWNTNTAKVETKTPISDEFSGKSSADNAQKEGEAQDKWKKEQEEKKKKEAEEQEKFKKEHPNEWAIEERKKLEDQFAKDHSRENYYKAMEEIVKNNPTLNKHYRKMKTYVNENYGGYSLNDLVDGIAIYMDGVQNEIDEEFKKAGLDPEEWPFSANLRSVCINYAYDVKDGIINPRDEFGLSNRDREQQRGQIVNYNLMNKGEISPIVTETSAQVKDFMDNLFVIENSAMFSDEEYQKAWEEAMYGGNLEDIDEYFKKIRQNEHKDPDTGLPYKEYECSIEEDMMMVNYHRQLGDPENYSENCRMCTIAMVLRQKGYDVSAGNVADATDGYSDWEMYSSDLDVFIGDEPVSYSSEDEFYSAIKDMPVGSYGNIDVVWKEAWWGHSMFYRIEDDGTFQIYDCQTGQKVDTDEIISSSYDWSTTRLDDKEVNGWYLREHNWTKYF